MFAAMYDGSLNRSQTSPVLQNAAGSNRGIHGKVRTSFATSHKYQNRVKFIAVTSSLQCQRYPTVFVADGFMRFVTQI